MFLIYPKFNWEFLYCTLFVGLTYQLSCCHHEILYSWWTLHLRKFLSFNEIKIHDIYARTHAMIEDLHCCHFLTRVISRFMKSQISEIEQGLFFKAMDKALGLQFLGPSKETLSLVGAIVYNMKNPFKCFPHYPLFFKFGSSFLESKR